MVGHRCILYSILKFDHIKTATCIQKHTLTYSHVWTQKEATRIEQASILWIFDIPLFPSAKPLCWRFTYQGGIRQAVEASRGEARMDVATHTLISILKRERQVGPCESTASLTHIRVPGQPELHIETLKTKKQWSLVRSLLVTGVISLKETLGAQLFPLLSLLGHKTNSSALPRVPASLQAQTQSQAVMDWNQKGAQNKPFLYHDSSPVKVTGTGSEWPSKLLTIGASPRLGWRGMRLSNFYYSSN